MLDRKSFLLAVLFVLLISVSAGGMAVYVLSDPGIKDAYLLANAVSEIKKVYPERFDGGDLVRQARRGMLEGLDRYSGYMEKERFERMHQELSGGYEGLGITVADDTLGLMVVAVRENGPAQKAGVRPGDIIVAADSVELAGLTSIEATRMLRGEKGTTVWLTLRKARSQEMAEVEVTRERIPLLHIPFAGFTPDSLLYIRLLDFESGASDDIKAAIDSLYTEQVKASTKGFILDLRSNPGGLFYEARRTADLFLKAGQKIVGTSGRSRWENEEYYASDGDVIEGVPMVVIVDGGSASSSEIVSGALQQSGRAVLVGDTTFGKGLVQGFVRFPDGDGLRLTVSRYYVGDSIYLNQFDSVLNEVGQGLPPDFYFDYADRDLSLLELERSMLLFRFAEENAKEIVAIQNGSDGEAELVDRFADYAGKNGYSYLSQTSYEVEAMGELARALSSSAALVRSVEKLRQKSAHVDGSMIRRHRDYVLRRLRQLAWQFSDGEYEAYRRVIVVEQPVIRYAAKILSESR